jgi:hypothetical protein
MSEGNVSKEPPRGGDNETMKPWEAIGMSRATWYRQGKPTQNHGAAGKGKTRAERDAEASAELKHTFGMSLRTFQRMTRAMKSEFGGLLYHGKASPGEIDKLLSDPVRLQRVRAAIAASKDKAQ